MLSRRDFLRGSLCSTALALAAPTLPVLAQSPKGPYPGRRRFAPVNVSPDRIIRTAVGLRPFRDAGYRVEAEKLGGKLLVHNYGHGGGGISLSWGTATEALELVRDYVAEHPRRAGRFAVVGCGVIGLTMARTLQTHLNGQVTVYAKALPPETTSNIAGGFWLPVSVYDHEKTTPGFREKFQQASTISQRAFQLMAGPHYGVRWIEAYDLFEQESSLGKRLPGGNDLYPPVLQHREPDIYFGEPYVRQYSTLMIEPNVYLPALLRDFYQAGGKIVLRDLEQKADFRHFQEGVVFNCTGLGSHALLGDHDLYPIRGQLEISLPQPEIDYCYLGKHGYMFPRTDGIVLGGSYDKHDWSLEPDPSQSERILAGHRHVSLALQGLRS